MIQSGKLDPVLIKWHLIKNIAFLNFFSYFFKIDLSTIIRTENTKVTSECVKASNE